VKPACHALLLYYTDSAQQFLNFPLEEDRHKKILYINLQLFKNQGQHWFQRRKDRYYTKTEKGDNLSAIISQNSVVNSNLVFLRLIRKYTLTKES